MIVPADSSEQKALLRPIKLISMPKIIFTWKNKVVKYTVSFYLPFSYKFGPRMETKSSHS